MQPFKNFTGLVAPMDRSNVDTDQVIPKQFLKAVVRSGLARGLFFDWRDQPDKGYVLDQPRFKGASILVARANFGCGSSREHAVWSLAAYGIRAVIAPSFGDIFFNNCFKVGVLPVVVSPETGAALRRQLHAMPGAAVTVDLERQSVVAPDGTVIPFAVDAFRRQGLLRGQDEIALTLEHAPAIAELEWRRLAEEPWLTR